MPSFRKLSPAEVAALESPSISPRAQILREYDAYLASFAVGDYGRAELFEGERRPAIRRRLQAAACRRGLALCFHSGPGPLTFHVAMIPAISATPLREIAATTPSIVPKTDIRPPPPRSPRRRETAAERYHDVLPRWMRTGQRGSRPNGSPKRRTH